jgi:hypothetical protein
MHEKTRKRKHGELVIELGASEFFCEFCASSRPFKFIAAKKHKKARVQRQLKMVFGDN